MEKKEGESGMEQKGYITVCFSIVLLLIIALLSSTVESVRLCAIHMRCLSSGALGLESVFADYSIPVLTRYGLLCLDKSYGTENPDKVVDYLKEYVDNQISPQKDLWITTSNQFYPIQLKDAEIISSLTFTEKGGDVLEEEILEYMKDAIPADIIEEILKQMNLLEQTSVITEIFDKIGELQEKASKVDEAIQGIYHKLEVLKGVKKDVSKAKGKILEIVDQLEGVEGVQSEVFEEEEKERWEKEIERVQKELRSQMGSFIREQEKILDVAEDILKERDRYLVNTEIVESGLLEIEDFYEKQIQQLDEEMSISLKGEIEQVHIYSGGKGDYYKVEEISSLVKENMKGLEESLKQLDSYTEKRDMSGLLKELENYEDMLDSWDMEMLQLNYSNHVVKKEDKGFLDDIKDLRQHGVLAFFIESEVLSEKGWERERYEDRKEGDREQGNMITEMTEKVLINEYIRKKFGCFTDKIEGTVLDYEIEYILSGKNSDRDNLEQTIGKLLLIREGMNLIYLMQDSAKKAEAESLAIALVGFTGMYGVIKVTQVLILAIWAFVEAVIDVRLLLEGEKVALLKNSGNWNTSLEGVKNFKKEMVKTGIKQKEGLSYQDYLRVLLFLSDDSQKDYRMMDLIEENIRQQEGKGFSLDNCVSYMEVRLKFIAEPLFFKVGSGNKYEIEGENRHGYVR